MMFLYWDGYEIDGSDTDFDIILPETIQIKDFIESFLSIPIFCKKSKPVYYTLPSRSLNRGYVAPEARISNMEFEERLLSGNYSSLSIMVCCRYPEQLEAGLRSQIFALSEGRTPHEEAYGQVENPCSEPANQGPFMTIDLTITKVEKDWDSSAYIYEESKGAYTYNFSLSSPIKRGDTYLTLGIPVSSNYEYAMYIIKHMEAHFPSIRIWGGIECSCGATFGNSLYAYEKIHIPIQYSVKNTLKRLTEYGIIRSYVLYYKGKWKTEYSKTGFFLKSHEKNWLSPPQEEVPFAEYYERVDLTLSMPLEPFEQVFETAASILLPPPDFYAKDPHVVEMLEEKLEEADRQAMLFLSHKEQLYCGYVAFVTVNDKPVCEFRIRYQLKEYFSTLLELVESGMIDFIKEETYAWRNA